MRGALMRTTESHENYVQKAARDALEQLLKPLAEFVIRSGLSTAEFQSIFRRVAVKNAAVNQLAARDRVNIAGIAAATGISRGEVSRILKPTKERPGRLRLNAQQPTNRILAGWHADPKFKSKSGTPSELKLYGRGASFDALAKKYGGGIPTRAAFDELIQAKAIEVLDTKQIRAKSSTVASIDINPYAVKAFGVQISQFLETAILNLVQPENPKFIASVSGRVDSAESSRIFQRDLASKGASFLADLQNSLGAVFDSTLTGQSAKHFSTASVTVLYHETKAEISKKPHRHKRHNFRRDAL